MAPSQIILSVSFGIIMRTPTLKINHQGPAEFLGVDIILVDVHQVENW